MERMQGRTTFPLLVLARSTAVDYLEEAPRKLRAVLRKL
jgi:hypothetical protein